MNPPAVLSVRLLGDEDGPQTGDVVLDIAQVFDDIHQPLTITNEKGEEIVYNGYDKATLEIYSKEHIDELTNFTSFMVVEKLPPVLDARDDTFYILKDGSINFVIGNKWYNQGSSLDIGEVVQAEVGKIVEEKLEPIQDKMTDIETEQWDLDRRISQEIIDRKVGDNELQKQVDALGEADGELQRLISVEVQARLDGDKENKTAIDNEATTRREEDSKLSKNISDNKESIKNLNESLNALDVRVTSNANSILGTKQDLTAETNSRIAGDKGLQDQIETLKSASYATDTEVSNLKTQLASDEQDIVTLQGQVDKIVEQDIAVSGNASTVSIKETKINIKTGALSEEETALPIVSESAAGIMNPATYKTIGDNAAAIDSILNGAVSIATLPEYPTQKQLTDAWKEATKKETVINGAKISDPVRKQVWTYYANVEEWQAVETGVTEIVVSTATNDSLGLVQGDATTAGKVFLETNGTMSVNGWDATQQSIKNNTNSINSLRTTVNNNATEADNRLNSLENNTQTLSVEEFETLWSSLD